jgi:hypothetical protein
VLFQCAELWLLATQGKAVSLGSGLSARHPDEILALGLLVGPSAEDEETLVRRDNVSRLQAIVVECAFACDPFLIYRRGRVELGMIPSFPSGLLGYPLRFLHLCEPFLSRNFRLSLFFDGRAPKHVLSHARAGDRWRQKKGEESCRPPKDSAPAEVPGDRITVEMEKSAHSHTCST